MRSIVQQRDNVRFPAFMGERIYMRPFTIRNGLPDDLQRWQPTVDAMLVGVSTEQPIYLMVDQAAVRGGETHRRGGVHIDGFWMPSIQAHGSPYVPPHHNTEPTPRRGNHVVHARGDHGHSISPEGQWPVEAVILASNVKACRAWSGEFTGVVGKGGDCSHMPTDDLSEVAMEAGIAYAGNVTMLHESIVILKDCLRTVVRLNVPGWAPTP